MQAAVHIPVMPGQIVHWLAPRPDGVYVDCTVGLGGHTLALLRAGAGRVLALDRDVSALEQAEQVVHAAGYGSQVRFVQSSFHLLDQIMAEQGWGPVQGMVLDLGVSSMQLDDAKRGFSFVRSGPLDMRMDRDSDLDAATLVNRMSERDLKELIWSWGQEPMAGRIARRIVSERDKEAIVSTQQLAEIVSRAYPAKRRATARNHPATRTFQALRIAVNQELDVLQAFVRMAPELLEPGGRLAVLSFHSLEDRIVKHGLKAEAKGCFCPSDQAFCTCDRVPRMKILTKKPIIPEQEEREANPRSRSAKLRVAERL